MFTLSQAQIPKKRSVDRRGFVIPEGKAEHRRSDDRREFVILNQVVWPGQRQSHGRQLYNGLKKDARTAPNE